MHKLRRFFLEKMEGLKVEELEEVLRCRAPLTDWRS